MTGVSNDWSQVGGGVTTSKNYADVLKGLPAFKFIIDAVIVIVKFSDALTKISYQLIINVV